MADRTNTELPIPASVAPAPVSRSGVVTAAANSAPSLQSAAAVTSNSVSRPSLATGMSSDPANSGGEHEAVAALPIEHERFCIELETGTSPGASGPERDIFGATNTELSLRRANASDVLSGALPVGPGRKTGSDLAHVPAVETLANMGVTAGETATNSESREPAEGVDLDQNVTGGVVIPLMVSGRSGEFEGGEESPISARVTTSPALLAPVEPAAVEVGCGQAPEFNSDPMHHPSIPPASETAAGASASPLFSSSEFSPVDGSLAGRREGRFLEKLPAESTGSAQAVASSPCKATDSRTNFGDPGMAGFDIDFEYEVAILEAQWLRDGIIMNARTFFTEAANSICPDSNSSA